MDNVLNGCYSLCKTCTAKNETKTRDLALPAWFQVKSSLVVSRTVPLGRWRSHVPLDRGVSGASIPGRAKAFQLCLLESGGREEVSYMKCF